ncbi:MAG: hypothetical protein Q9219_007499 [cf. Caloplaca sp. 3 TL-2023]
MAGGVNGMNGNYAPETEMSHLTMRNQPLEVREPSGYTNGSISPSKYRYNQSSIRRSESHSTTRSYSTEQQITVLKEAVIATRAKFVADFDDVDDHFLHHTTIEDFLEFIERERLTHMPHRGSHWDKVLKWAEFFSLQVSGYAETVESFMAESKFAARLIWTACRALLQLGPNNARALEITFSVFYKLGLSISLLLRRNTLLTSTEYLRCEVGYAFNDLLLLVRDVSLFYRARLLGASQDTKFDFNAAFDYQISGFHQRKAGIVNAMWEHALGHQALSEMESLRKWLQPGDRASLRLLAENETKRGRTEFTCEWFQSQLLAFTRSRDDVLAIQGPAACGKSVLAGWIVERLQRPLGKKSHDTLSCTVGEFVQFAYYSVPEDFRKPYRLIPPLIFGTPIHIASLFRNGIALLFVVTDKMLEPDVVGEATSFAVAKRLLLQLLDKNVGDKNLYRDLVEARRYATSKNMDDLEKSLWKCIDTGLDQYQGTDYLMIVVDGLDELEGGNQHIIKTMNHLASLASKHSNVQTIVFSHGPVTKSSHGHTREFAITSDHTHEDLRLVIHSLLRRQNHFQHQDEHGRERIVGQLLHAARGNFIWARLAVSLLQRESSHDGFDKTLKSATESLKSVDEVLTRLTSTMDLAKTDFQLLLSWMLLADRPLTIAEVKLLFQIDLVKKTFVERDENAMNDVLSALKPFVTQQDGFIRFRHSTIRRYMLNIQTEGKRLRNRRDAQTDLTIRLLAYCHFHLTKMQDPTFDMMEDSEIQKLFSQYGLLEYAVCNWLYHFKSSSLHQSNGGFQLSSDFKAVFPGTTQMPLLEWGCWRGAESQAVDTYLYELALKVRQEVLTQSHRSVLQGLIVCGNAYRNKHQITEAGSCFYRASKISQHLLRKHHTFTVACSTTFLTVTESLKISSRTEVATWKEETLTYVIDTYKHQHGKTHDLVIRYTKMLAQLYVDIHEEQRAEKVWRELREIMVLRFGKGSKEEASISEKLTVVLKKGEKKTDIIEYEQGIFNIVTELDVWDTRRIRMTIELAMSYENRGEILMAEGLFVMLWRRLTEQCHHHHHHHGVEIHVQTIDVVIEYVRFLRRCHRHDEAANVLICIWSEYEEYDFESETLFLRLKIIGQLLREISLLSVAVSVFKKCWAWFKSRGKVEHAESCEIMISETMVEIVTSVSSTTTMTTSSTTTTSTETVIREVFESTLSRTTITSQTISTCKNLISYYMKLEQWSQAIEVTKKSLLIIWKSIIAGGGMIALPKDFGSEAIDIAIQLAICHHRSSHFYEAEEIYVRIYHACRSSCRIDDDRLINAYTTLVKFYEERRHWQKIIKIYQEILIEYRTHLGSKHPLTIRTLYVLGSLCLEHGHGNGYEYYEEIVTVLNQGSHICHTDALEAMMIICRWRYEAGHWHKLRTACKILWETWRDRHAGYEKFTADFVEILYLRYRYVLEYHVQCEYAVIRELTIEYRKACLKNFGISVAITIKAMVELAHICMKSEKYMQEAISLYEEVLTHIESTSKTTTTTTVITTTSITEIKQHLTKAYIHVCSHESVSSQTIERAIKVILERYRSLQITLGWAHVETLTVLREVVLMQMKLKKQESVSIVTRILLEATVEIVTREKHSKTLHEAGKLIGKMYMNCGLASYAHDMIHELRMHIITGTTTSNNKLGLKLDKAVGRVSFVFLVTLEQIISENLSISYAEVMADYITESVLYESYTRSLKQSTTIMIGHAARLRAFLTRHKRQGQINSIDDQSFEMFIKQWSLNGQLHIRKLFYISLLEQIGEDIREIQIGDVACRSSATKVAALLGHDRVQDAYEVTACAFAFLKQQNSFHKIENVTYGFKLSGLMVGIGLNKPVKGGIDTQLHQKMRQLSQDIIREVLKACKEAKIDFVRLRLADLNGLIALLGEQQNYVDLEWILEVLWKSREVQKNWKPDTIIHIGRRFVQARYLNASSKERRSEAIRVCEDICYNLRRVWGSHPETLKMSNLLSQLYTHMGHYREAQGVHENNLRLVVEGDDGDDRTLDTMDAETARLQVELLKQSFLRLRGWDKSPEIYKELIDDLREMPEYKGKAEFKAVRPIGEWNIKEAPSETLGKFEPPRTWEVVRPEAIGEGGEIKDVPPAVVKRPGGNVKRATSNWGMNFVQNLLHGAHGDGGAKETTGKVNGVQKRQAESSREEEDGGYQSAAEEVL